MFNINFVYLFQTFISSFDIYIIPTNTFMFFLIERISTRTTTPAKLIGFIILF